MEVILKNHWVRSRCLDLGRRERQPLPSITCSVGEHGHVDGGPSLTLALRRSTSPPFQKSRNSRC